MGICEELQFAHKREVALVHSMVGHTILQVQWIEDGDIIVLGLDDGRIIRFVPSEWLAAILQTTTDVKED